MTTPPKPFRILSLDGGGIRGIIPALILAEIEKRTGKPIHQLFDFIAGTSTGGIISLGLGYNKPGSSQPYEAKDLVSLYEQNGPELFKKTGTKKIPGIGLIQEKYSQHAIEQTLKSFFGNLLLHQTCRADLDVLITSYDIEMRRPWLFKSHRAKGHGFEDKQRDFLLWQVARATSAAPTYFEPFKINLSNNDYMALVDGGVFANNPALCAYAEAKVIWAKRNEQRLHEAETADRDLMIEPKVEARDDDNQNFFMLSIGTGTLKERYDYADSTNWGVLDWIEPLIDIMMQGSADSVDYQMRQLLPDDTQGGKHYYRIQTALNSKNTQMDDVSASNIRELKLQAGELISQQSDLIDNICRDLLRFV